MTKEILYLLLKNNIIYIDNLPSFENEEKENLSKDEVILNLKTSFLSLGYILDEKDVNLSSYPLSLLKRFYNRNFNLLKEIKGSKKHVIFYPNFPKVDNISKKEMYLRAALHYLTATKNEIGFLNDDLKEEKRLKDEIEKINYETLKVLNEKAAIKFLAHYFKTLFEGNSPITYAMKDPLLAFTNKYKIEEIEDIPFKENIYLYIRTKKNNKKISYNHLKFCKNVNDVLRAYQALIEDYPIFYNNHLKSIPRYTRRVLIRKIEELIQNNKYAIEDFNRYKEFWKKAFKYLHVFEYKTIAPNLYDVAYKIRNEKIDTYNSKLNKYLVDQNKYLSLIKVKPGEFARKLFYTLSIKDFNEDLTLEAFKEIASNVSTKVLLELYTYALNRNKFDKRVFKIVSPTVFKMHLEAENRDKINDELLIKVEKLIKETLILKFSSYPKIEKKVYVDETLKDIVIPPIIRNSSLTFSNLLYGSHVKLGYKNYLRCFTTWKNNKNERIDIDLSMEVFDENLNQIASLAWHNLEGGKKYDAYHSGDITSAPSKAGSSEFIDINLAKARLNARYLAICNTIYSGVPFDQIEYCYSGIMLSENRLNSLYREDLVNIKAKLNQKNGNMNLAFIIDLKLNELIWLDVPISEDYYSVSENNLSILAALIDGLKTRMNFYDFIKLHQNHVNFIQNKEDADLIIGNDINADINPIDLNNFSINWF